ncbi:type I methionyl aminopeptidase [Haploplasma axanthum]|uniref:Methionine aminopeptidase n=1 Tax=Haploplasma axanthum TaxID=29552 RepID=A0A449BBH8_HAPAX|nr:type I methionyl aminopeptidase [Haploplasma axanthum]VEU79813.1 Methionine aminopeptidase [Haploplasma axanthum]
MEYQEIIKRLNELRKIGKFVPHDSMIKTKEQIEGIIEASRINTLVLDEVEKNIKAGMTTLEIDNIVKNKTVELGGTCPCFGFEGFPMNCCTSINDLACHGIPDSSVYLEDGDIINVDCTTEYKGYIGDASRMFSIGEISDEAHRLIEVTKYALDESVKAIIPWKSTLDDIGYIINKIAKRNKFSVVREIGGHGVGLELHEEPFVSHYGKKGEGMLIVPGMIFTIEPLISAGSRKVFIDESDGWGIYTVDGSLTAQVEYTILITEDGAKILSR